MSVKKIALYCQRTQSPAGYMNYSPPMWDRVLADCDMALKLDPVYTKALNRRAEALESMDQLEDALRGPPSVSISLSSDN